MGPRGCCHRKADEAASTRTPVPPTKAPGLGEAHRRFLAEPEWPLGLPRASVSYSPQPVFNTKRGKGGMKGARSCGGGWAWSGLEDPPKELWGPGLLRG